MNDASQWRQRIAHRIAPVYAANPCVAAVLLGGSAARGHADAYSDIELGVFWHEPPSDAERQAVVAGVDADLIRLYPYDADEGFCADDYMIGRCTADQPQSGVLIEVMHLTVASLQRTFDSVLNDYNPDETEHNIVAGIVDGVPLAGPDLIQRWQQRAAHYPHALSVAVVRRHATIDHFWRWEMLLQRNENLMLVYSVFSQVQQKLLHVLLGLNHVYFFGFKWIDKVIERLAIAPSDLAARLRRVYQVAPADGAQHLTALVEETYDLIEQHVPEVDVEWLRKVFRYRRPVWEHAPSDV